MQAGAALTGGLALQRTGPVLDAAAARHSSGGTTTMGYQLEGRILEACNCNVLCPCWIGENPDRGVCEAVVAWRIDAGTAAGVDLSGRTLALVSHIPGNVLAGNWKGLVFIDDAATPEQQEALLKVWTGELGGPVADLMQLVGEVVAVERAPITFTVDGGRGTLRIGDGPTPTLDAELEPYLGATGEPTTLVDTVFSTIPGSPAYVGKAAHFRRATARYGLVDLDLQGRNAIQGHFRFEV
jgi:hypothetical protein